MKRIAVVFATMLLAAGCGGAAAPADSVMACDAPLQLAA